MATTAALQTWQRVYADPERERTDSQWTSYAARYRWLWAMAQNAAYDDLAPLQGYLERHGLYPYTRGLYNPFGRLVSFYAAQVYPGILLTGDMDIPAHVREAIPLVINKDRVDVLRPAIQQLLAWSNFQTRKDTYVRFGATLGEVFVEITDDVPGAKVAYKVRWPGLVTALDLDDYGNVKAYQLEYDFVDEDGQTRRFRKNVDKERFATYRDDKLYSYEADRDGNAIAPEYDNPYGPKGDAFVPAVWAMHTDYGSDHGTPCFRSGWAKLDELNAFATRMHDYIGLQSKTPSLLEADGDVENISDTVGATGRDRMIILKGPLGTAVHKMEGNLDVTTALPFMQQLIAEMEADNTELTMWTALRSMSALTGPAAERLLGDVQGFVFQAQASYDTQLVKLDQMGTAMGGFRANRGDWGPKPGLTASRAKFLPYGLDSYANGDLDHAIGRRPLVPITEVEKWAAKAARAGVVRANLDADMPLELAMREAEYSDEDIAGITVDRVAAIARAQLLAQEDVEPIVDQ